MQDLTHSKFHQVCKSQTLSTLSWLLSRSQGSRKQGFGLRVYIWVTKYWIKGHHTRRGYHVCLISLLTLHEHPHHHTWCCKLIITYLIFLHLLVSCIPHSHNVRHTPFFFALIIIYVHTSTPLGKGLTISYFCVQYIYFLRHTNSLAHT